MDIEGEINDLRRRVDELEGAVNVLTGQMRHVHPELVALRKLSVDRFDGLDALIGRFVSRMDTLNSQIWSLRDDFPTLVDKAVRKSLGSFKS
jgi:hypothetical protein